MGETEERARFTQQLVDAGHYVPTEVPGLFGHGRAFEELIRRFDALVRGVAAADGAEEVCFPPAINREVLRRTGYMDSFPQLCGSVHSFVGDDRTHASLSQRVQDGGDWTEFLTPTAVTLAPAGCYPLYPTQRGTLPDGGKVVELQAWVFRHEPSDDPARLQMFRMRENVRLGRPDEVETWRDRWRERGMELLSELGLDVRSDVAADPFFGRGGRLMKATQKEQQLKFEILVPIVSDAPTAIASFNYHQEKFGETFGIRSADGGIAHTACLGFGLERVALALLKTHGIDPAAWPTAVRRRLYDDD